ncbi:MAG: ATP-dependent helicase, partial [Firmicutes bacterium]|nr:ATP-dependent helicase [Bacillota bacterium]
TKERRVIMIKFPDQKTIESTFITPSPISLPAGHPNGDFLKKLQSVNFSPNAEQYEAIFSDSKRLLIHAGAGSGKTTTLIGKLMYFLDRGVRPEKIMFLTFMKKSALDVQSRVSETLPSASKIVSGTFHSVFGSLLMKDDAYKDLYNSKLIQGSDRTYLIAHAMKRAGIDTRITTKEEVESIINLWKNMGIEPDEAMFNFDRKLGQAYLLYEEEKSLTNDRMDFDDIILQFRWVASSFSHLFDVVLVDEFQDVSKIQFEAIMNLLSDKTYFVAVGDSDQSIYAFRGSSPEFMNRFRDYFSDATVVKMGTNYRSHAEIVQAGKNALEQNVREDIDLKAIRESDLHPRLLFENRDEDMANRILDEVFYLSQSGYSLNDICILFRSSFVAESMIKACSERSVLFRLEADPFLLYDKPIVQAMIGMMECVYNPDDLDAIGKFAPMLLYIKKSDLPMLKTLAVRNHCFLLEALPRLPFRFGNQQAINLMHTILSGDKMDTPLGLLKTFRNFFVDGFLKSKGLTGNILLGELDDFESSITSFSTLEAMKTHIATLREELEKAKKVKPNKNALTLSTVHRAKGLEWPIVYVTGVDPNIFPAKNGDIEEERRLLYVALTRAKEILTVCTKDLAGNDFVESIKFIEKTS